MFNHRGGAVEDYYGCGGSEFDSEEIMTTHGLNGDLHHNQIQPSAHIIDDNEEEDEEEEDDIDYCPSGSSAIAA